MATFVLDSFALLSYFLRERAASVIERHLDDAASGLLDLAITTVNLGEVVYRVERERGFNAGVRALQTISLASVDVHPVDSDLAIEAARCKVDFRMGYLDCFVVALARQLSATILTGDPDFQRAEHLVSVSWLER